MQVGRWNHQTSGNSGSTTGARSPRNSSGSSSYSSRPSAAPKRYSPAQSRRDSRFGKSSGPYGRAPMRSKYPPRGRGFGSFGTIESEIAKFKNNAVVTTKEEVFVPENTFSDFNINEHLKKNILAHGYNTPTPIQDKTIPHALLGHDIVGLAETGTGKTASFLIPLIDKVVKQKDEKVLIMAPTRELAVQIERELAGFAKGLGFRGMVAVGGTNIGPQISALKHNPSFVIGTPGRMKDLMERKALDLSTFGNVVLDEADRMMDMGFIDDMRFILGKMKKENRQTLFFCATMEKGVEKLIGDFLHNPMVISVRTRDTSKNIEQDIVRIPRGKDKFEVLIELMQNRDFNKVLIFGRTKHGVERLSKDLSRRHIHAESIHGDKTYNARIRALEAFKMGRVVALVATDVAARGLDIPAVSHVINYDLPSTYEDYVHRVGRTGRASAKGLALTFIQDR